MIKKESQRRKIEGSKKESRRQAKKETVAERERPRRKIKSRRQGNKNTGEERD